MSLFRAMTPPSWKVLLVYAAGSLLLDAVSDPQAVLPLALAPWTPPPGLTLAFLILFGLRYAPWLLLVTVLVGLPGYGAPENWFIALAAAGLLTLVLTGAAALLTRKFHIDPDLESRRDLMILLAASLPCAVLDAAIHILPAEWGKPGAELLIDMASFGIGALLRLMVVTPLVLAHHRPVWRVRREALIQALTILAVLWLIFGANDAPSEQDHFKLFYLLFLPLIWIAMRFGIQGATLGLFFTLAGLNLILEWHGLVGITVAEFHMLMLGVALTGLFLGVTVSERRAAEDRLIQREGDFNQAMRLAAATEMTQAMAHELNQPLSAAANYARAARAMLESPETSPVLLATTLDKLEREVGRAGQVTRRLREFYRGGVLHLETVPAQALMEEALAPVRRRAERNGINLRVRLPDALARLRVDRVQAATVLHNLVANAVDSLGARGGQAGQVEILVRREGGMLRFTVRDDGPGIAPEMESLLFRSFSTSKPDGMGLGLAICRTLVEAHGGRLWLESAQPACFAFTLPCEEG